MSERTKIILDLCGGTGAWSRPYKEAGYDVRLATLPEFDVTDWRNSWLSDLVFEGKVYGILAAPPCTEFSLAKNNEPRNFSEGMRTVRACMDIIWYAREMGKPKWWALENPRGFLRQFLGKPAFTFEQWEFGDRGIKPTDLWGYFNEPKKTEKDRTKRKSKKYPSGRYNAEGWSKSAEKRAITPKGFSEAFFKANQ